MTLFLSSFLTGTLLLVVGVILSVKNNKLRSSILNFPRSKTLSLWFVGTATTWFLWRHVAFLSEADFGNYKLLIGAIALATAILSFIYVADFLAVRGLAMMILLWSREVLDSAFLHEAHSRLFLVSSIYLLIIFSIYFGAWPYKIHDFIEWLRLRNLRISLLGWVFSFFGISIILLTFTY